EYSMYESTQDKALPATMFDLAEKIKAIRSEMKVYGFMDWKKGNRHAKLVNFKEELLNKYRKCKKDHMKKYSTEEPTEDVFRHLNRGQWTKRRALKEIGCLELDPEEGTDEDDDSSSDEPRKKTTKKRGARTRRKEESDDESSSEVSLSEESVSEEEFVPPKKHNRKKHSKNFEAKHEESSQEDEDSSEEDEPNGKVHNIISMKHVLTVKDVEWMVHPNHERVESASDFTVNGKCIFKLRGTNAYIGLCEAEDLEDLLSKEKVKWLPLSRISSLEEKILKQMKLRPLSVSETLDVHSEAEKPQEDVIQVVGPLKNSEVKWRRFDQELEYSKNLLVGGKHMLKMCKSNNVVGLVTKDHIRSEIVEYDAMSHKEKECVFAKGFVPYDNDKPEETEPEGESDATTDISVVTKGDEKDLVVRNADRCTDEEIQQLDISGTAAPGGTVHSMVRAGGSSTVSVGGDIYAVYKTEATLPVQDDKDARDVIAFFRPEGSPDEDKKFLQEMGEIYGELRVMRAQISTGGFSKDNAMYAELRDVVHLVQRHYETKEKVHLEKYGALEPHPQILALFEDTAQKNKESIIASYLDDILKGGLADSVRDAATQRQKKTIKSRTKVNGKQKRIRSTTVETDEE
ncbi:hypothetical protein EDD11_010122, partial [Mortierella claussenii]